MFDLNHAISKWRSALAADRKVSVEALEELESHLRQDVRLRIAAGNSAADAFQEATMQMGSVANVRAEFEKISQGPNWPWRVGLSCWAIAALLFCVLLWKQMPAKRLLFAHVYLLSLGYVTVYFAGALAMAGIALRRFENLSRAWRRGYEQGVGRFLALAATFTSAGLVVGAIWCKIHIGHFLVTEGARVPLEIGAYLVALWLVSLCAVRWMARAMDHLLVFAIAGNILVSVAWFGPIALALNRTKSLDTSYFWPFAVVFGIHLAFFFLGLTQQRTRRSA